MKSALRKDKVIAADAKVWNLIREGSAGDETHTCTPGERDGSSMTAGWSIAEKPVRDNGARRSPGDRSRSTRGEWRLLSLAEEHSTLRGVDGRMWGVLMEKSSANETVAPAWSPEITALVQKVEKKKKGANEVRQFHLFPLTWSRAIFSFQPQRTQLMKKEIFQKINSTN